MGTDERAQLPPLRSPPAEDQESNQNVDCDDPDQHKKVKDCRSNRFQKLRASAAHLYWWAVEPSPVQEHKVEQEQKDSTKLWLRVSKIA